LDDEWPVVAALNQPRATSLVAGSRVPVC